jgi:hypothetical protein
MTSDRHKIIADDDIKGSEYTVWSAYVPPQIRFVSPLPYATVVFAADQRSVFEAFADTEDEALANQAAVVTSIMDGQFEEQTMDDLELTDEQGEAYKQYMIEELSTKLATEMMSEAGLERDPATGHHPDCDGECGGSGTGTNDVKGEDLPGQYL